MDISSSPKFETLTLEDWDFVSLAGELVQVTLYPGDTIRETDIAFIVQYAENPKRRRISERVTFYKAGLARDSQRTRIVQVPIKDTPPPPAEETPVERRDDDTAAD